MRSEQPLISVIVSTYASETFMAECLDELLKQTIADQLEIIVVDAHSPEKEGEIVAQYKKKHRSIKYIRTDKRIGVYPAWNNAIKMSQGKYITPFSTNDRLNPCAYATLSAHLESHPDTGMVYADTYMTFKPHVSFNERAEKQGMELKWEDFTYELLLERDNIGPHPMWRREVHDEVGYFDKNYMGLGDQEFWLRMGRRYKIKHLPFYSGVFWWTMDSLSATPEAVLEGKNARRKYHQIYQKDLQKLEKTLPFILKKISTGKKAKALAIYTKFQPEFGHLQKFIDFGREHF